MKTIPRIESLRVQNYRALRKVEFGRLTPVTVLLGSNGSGKSTIFDLFDFLSECFQFGLRHAWDRRGHGKELKTRGAAGPVAFELKYREQPGTPLITYRLAIDQGTKGPEVVEEWLQWQCGIRPFRFLEFRRGVGRAASGELPDAEDQRKDATLRSPDLIAVNTLGQLAEHPRVAALREFISDWHLSYLSLEHTR
ncbi:MAG: AAA family ATPase, partial [Gammaproteobacteria bacterium]|nr:AAA family ATPase [Gammaproteobacteria bacterium]